ncbi:hypothetical protein [Kitasatospora griseola]|uniref:hypothetical protein n=1 Tax=Kitasatospora griseola TaxID=2064 RepID=UPI001670D611|nr:hypothetical protein [Kitasatospora griseola]GGQ94681.1 hypothetical protein GCM10010195_58190 [Kitasatospora griseola]
MRTTRTAVIYLCATEDPAGQPLLAEWCTQRAAADGLSISTVVTDTDELLPVEDRTGWQEVVALAAAGSISEVVTVHRGMVTADPRLWRRIAAGLGEYGVTLVTVRTPVTTPGFVGSGVQR